MEGCPYDALDGGSGNVKVLDPELLDCDIDWPRTDVNWLR